MIESLIIALREGIEIALVIGILIVYLQKIDHLHLIKSVFFGLATAILASITIAIILQKLMIDQEIFEGYLMLIAAVFVISMIVWMWISAKKIRNQIQERVNTIVHTRNHWQAHIGIFLFTFLMIVREGVETVIFLQAVSANVNGWQSVVGTTMGFSSAAIFAYLFVRGSVKIDVVRFLKVTAFTLIIFTLQLIVNAFHEFYEFGVFPSNPNAMAILGPIVQNNTLFILAIISIPAFMMIIPGKNLERIPSQTRTRGWQLSAGIASLCIAFFLGMGEVFTQSNELNLDSTSLDIPPDKVFSIPISTIDDGNIHRFSITPDTLEIRFIVLRTGLGKFATAFDACYACYSYGRYYLRKGELICSLCDAPSPLMRLKPTGEIPESDNSGSMEGNGCSPIYLPSTIGNGNIVITLKDLLSKRKYFDITEEP